MTHCAWCGKPLQAPPGVCIDCASELSREEAPSGLLFRAGHVRQDLKNHLWLLRERGPLSAMSAKACFDLAENTHNPELLLAWARAEVEKSEC